MKQKPLNYFSLLALFVAALLILGCDSDSVEPIDDSHIRTVSAEEAIDFVNNLSQSSRTDEAPYVTIYSDYISNQDIINTDETITVLPAVTAKGNSYSRVLMLNINGNTEAVVYSMFSDNDFFTENFFGEILITDLNGNFLNGYVVNNGDFVSQYIGTNSSSTTSRNEETECDCPYNECDFCSLEEVVITASNNSNPYIPVGSIFIYDIPTSGDGGDTDEFYVPTGGTGGSGGGGLNDDACLNGYIKNANNVCVLAEDKIDTSALEGKEKCAYEALEAARGDLFNQTIATFGVPGSSYNLTFIYADCEDPAEACTNASDIDNGNLIIKIDDRGLEVLEYAALLLHEGVHAEIYRYVHENGGNIDPNERINLYNKYKEYKVQSGSLANTAIAHHQHMADRYVYPIARAIKELDGHRFPLENYLGFGWDGLRKYGFDGYYNEDLEKVFFEDLDYDNKMQEILDSTIIGDDCDE